MTGGTIFSHKMMMRDRRWSELMCSFALSADEVKWFECVANENVLSRLKQMALFATGLVAHAGSLRVRVGWRETERRASATGRRVTRHALSG